MDDAIQPTNAVISMGQGYFLHTNGLESSKFHQCFNMAVSGLPIGVDEIIEIHWRPLGPSSPHLEIAPGGVLLSDDGKNAAVAITDLFGKRLRFAAGAIAEIPADLGRDLVIHELAHVHSLSESHLGVIDVKEKHQLQDAGSDLRKLNDLLEELADSRMQAWGFDPNGIREWTRDYLTKLGP